MGKQADMLTVAEVAAEFGVAYQTAYEAARDGRMEATKAHRVIYMIRRRDAVAYFKRTKRKAGRPKGT